RTRWRQGAAGRGEGRLRRKRREPALSGAHAGERVELPLQERSADLEADDRGRLSASHVRRCQASTPAAGEATRLGERVRGPEPGGGTGGDLDVAPAGALPRARRERPDDEPDRERDGPARGEDAARGQLEDE